MLPVRRSNRCRDALNPTARDSRDEPRSRKLAVALWLGIALLAPLALAHYVAAWGFVFDLAANLSYCAAAPLLLLAATSFWIRRPAAAVCSVALAAAAATPLLLRIDWPEPAGPPGSNVSVLFCNLEGKPAAWERLRQVIDQHQPDLVGLVEAGGEVVERIKADAALAKTHPYRITPEPGLQWTQVVLSRHPLELLKCNGDFQRYKFLYSFRRTACIDLPEGKILFTIEHPASPRNQRSWAAGNGLIQLLGELVRGEFATTGLPIIIAGDFNTTPAGYRDTLLRETTGLRGDPLAGLPQGTWPSSFPPYCRLPLDRVWASTEIVFTGSEVLANVSSDHRPILVSFRLAAEQ